MRSSTSIVTENLEIKLRSTQGMLDWLDNELASQQKRVEESERALAEYTARRKMRCRSTTSRTSCSRASTS